MRIIFIFLIIPVLICGDIRPEPIESKGIYPIDSCKIKLVSEQVRIDLYDDSSIVECTFNLYNLGDSMNLEIGFPEMRNYYYVYNEEKYEQNPIKIHFEVNKKKLKQSDIKYPKEYLSFYKQYVQIEIVSNKASLDSLRNNIYKRYKVNKSKKDTSILNYHKIELANKEYYLVRDSLLKMKKYYSDTLSKLINNENYPWFVWNEVFKTKEHKTVKVKYSLPVGIIHSYDNFFTYILHSGNKWYGKIDTIKVQLNYKNISLDSIININPSGYNLDSTQKTINWNMFSLDPSRENDIYFQYYNLSKKVLYFNRRKNKK